MKRYGWFIVAGILVLVAIIGNVIWSNTSIGPITEAQLAMGQVNGSTTEYVVGQEAARGHGLYVFNSIAFLSVLICGIIGMVKLSRRTV